MHLQKGFLPVQIALLVAMGVISLAVGYKAVTNSTEIRSKAASLYPDLANTCIQACNTITENSKKSACITDCAKKYNLIKVTPTPTKGLIKITPTPTPPKDCRTAGCQSGTTCSYINGLNQYKCISAISTPTSSKDCRTAGCQSGSKCTYINGLNQYKCVVITTTTMPTLKPTPTATPTPTQGILCTTFGFGCLINK